MSNVPTNLIPTRTTELPEYAGVSQAGYFPYVIDGRTYKVQFSQIASTGSVPSSRTISAGAGLVGGGDLSENRTFAINFSSATPQPLGVASAGTGSQAARDDHIHPAVDLSDTTETQGVLPLTRGGTGNALSPVAGAIIYTSGAGLTQTIAGSAGQVLTSSGAGAPYWQSVVTSVNVSGGSTGLSFTGGPITSSGTITMSGTLAVANGGTGATTASVARANLSAAILGANSDITSMSGLTGGIATPDYIDFDIAATPTRASGRLWWDNSDSVQTLNLGMAGGNATLQIGEEMYFRVKASSAITEGQGVMFTGTVGGSGAITAAPATGLTKDTASYFMGVATEDIPLNGWGYITQFGLVRGINTTGGAEAWVDGQILYYNPAVAGGLTKNVPSAPAAKIEVAAVVNAASGGSGSLFVRPISRFSLGQLNDVETSAASNLDLLQYNGAGGYWQHKAPSLITVGEATTISTTLGVAKGGTGTATAFTTGSVVFAGASGVYAQDNANFFWDDTNNRLGVGTATPAYVVDINGSARVGGALRGTSGSVASGATITPTSDTTNQYNVTALAVGATFAAPSGTPVDGQKLNIRIKDNGSSQTLAWTTGTSGSFRVIGTTLPTTTVANKTTYVGCIYNSADARWDVVAVAQEV